MTAVAFDTLKFSRKLESVGIPREHAIGIAEAVAEVQAEHRDELATKGDLKDIRNEIKDARNEIKDVCNEISSLRSELKADIKELELRMTIKFGAIAFLAAGTMAGIVIAALRLMLPKTL